MLHNLLQRLFFGIWFLPMVAGRAQSTQEIIAKGDALRQTFDTRGAFELYSAAYRLDSTNVDVLCRLSQELIELGNELPKSDDQKSRYDEALTYARKAMKHAEDSLRVFEVLGRAIEKVVLYESGKKKIKLLTELYSVAAAGVAGDSLNDRCLHLLGRWHWTMMDVNWLVKGYSQLTDGRLPEEPSHEKAEQYFLKAIAVNGRCIGHFIDLGKTYVRLENWHDARLAFEEIAVLPNQSKSDARWKRDARKYLTILESGEYAHLKDAVEE